MKNALKLPAIKGIIGDWVYYQTTLPFQEVVSRIDNNHSIREYKSLDDQLQRELSSRSKKIAAYLVREKARFFNTVIIGLFGDAPNWYTFGFSKEIYDNYSISEHTSQTIGILELTGNETLFSIDGQHRIEGIKKALKKNKDEFKLDELPIIIIAHSDTKIGKQRTRRLFSEINTKAERVTGLDDLITNEENPIFINARRLFAEYKPFNKGEFIQLSHKANIDANSSEFTTILNLKEINKELYKKYYTHKGYRPTDKVINDLYEISEDFWNESIANVKEYHSVLVEKKCKVNDFRFKLSDKSGGSLLFRPIGLRLIATAYTYAKMNNAKVTFWKKIKKADFELNGNYWHSIAWDKAKKVMIPRRDKLLKEYLFYLLGFDYDKDYLVNEYNIAFGISKDSRKKKKLPKKL